MKWLILIATAVLVTLTPTAQSPVETCPDAVATANRLLAEISLALDEERYTDAQDLLREARQLIGRACVAADVDTEAAEVAPTEALSIRGNSSLNADSQVTPPDTAPDGNVTYIRVLNTVADSEGPIDMSLNGFGVVVNNLNYGEFSGLIPMPSGTLTFNDELRWEFTANSTWVVMQVGLNETVSVALEPISVVRNQLGGMARLRIVQAISGTEFVAVTSTDGTSFGSALGWLGVRDIDLTPGSYTLRADTVSGGVLVPDTDFVFEADHHYMLVIIGGKDGDPAPQFATLISPQDVTRVQFTNDRTEAVDIHYRPGNAKVVEALEPGATSDWVTLPSGAVTFIAYDVGTGPTGQEKASAPLSLRTGRDLSISVRPNGNMRVDSVAFTE